nr:diguanylate cyclase [Mesorhizobium sp. L2C066B000]
MAKHSVGVATVPNTNESPNDLVKAADLALFRAKSEGRDRVVVDGA